MFSKGCAIWRSFFLLIAFLMPTLPSPAQKTGDKAIIVFDASGSMWGQIDGKSKIQIARETLDSVLGGLPRHLQLGMIAYGHNRKGDCSDIETMVNLGPASTTGRLIAQSVRRINPKGKTPLSDAVVMAAQQLRYTEDKATVILVTDGIETCNADPCALASQLEQSGIDFTAHVVGFGLTHEEGQQVACLAENTGGLYLQAGNANELADALGKTVAVAPEKPMPVEKAKKKPKHNLIGRLSLTEGSDPLPKEATNGVAWYIQSLDNQGSLGKKLNISRSEKVAWSGDQGHYLVSITYRLGGKLSEQVTLEPFETLDQTFSLNAARIQGVSSFMQDDFNLSKASLVWTIKNTKTKKKANLYGDVLDVIVPSGSYEISHGLRGEKANMNPPRAVQLAAGEVKQMDFILPNSKVTIEALEADQTRNTSIRQRISLRNEDGSAGKTIKYEASAKPVFLRPGAYVVSIELWDGTKRKPVEAPIDVGLGEKHVFAIQLPQ